MNQADVEYVVYAVCKDQITVWTRNKQEHLERTAAKGTVLFQMLPAGRKQSQLSLAPVKLPPASISTPPEHPRASPWCKNNYDYSIDFDTKRS